MLVWRDDMVRQQGVLVWRYDIVRQQGVLVLFVGCSTSQLHTSVSLGGPAHTGVRHAWCNEEHVCFPSLPQC